MKLMLPTPTASIRHRDEHAAEILADIDRWLADIDDDLAATETPR